MAARITTGTSSCVAVVVYRPGSTPVTTAFYTELADLLDRLSTTADAVVLAGDVNIRLERASDPAATEFCDLIAGYGLTQHVTGPTHDAGAGHLTSCARGQTYQRRPSISLIRVCRTIGCYSGQRRYSVRRLSIQQVNSSSVAIVQPE